jgi:hypothetical protein
MRFSSARDEFHLAAIVQNLKTLALRALKPSKRADVRIGRPSIGTGRKAKPTMSL